MVLRSGGRFDPEVLLSAPRRSAGVPNCNGSRVLYTTSTYSFKTHKKDSELRVLHAPSGSSKQLAHNEDVSSPVWLTETDFVFLKSCDGGVTEVCVGDVCDNNRTVCAGRINGAVGNLKVAQLGHGGEFALVVSGQVARDGSLYNAEAWKSTHSTAKLYTKLFVRHWDRYETNEKNTLWYGKLTKTHDHDWKLSCIHDALAGLGLESPIPAFGGTDHFDVSRYGIVFVAKDPDLNPALNTKCNVYLLHINSWDNDKPSLAQKVVVPGFNGAATSPVFGSDGRQAAFLMMETNGYEADKNQIFTLPFAVGSRDVEVEAQRAFTGAAGQKGTWTCSPSSICFTEDSRHILAIAQENGHSRLFMLRSDLDQQYPYTLTAHGSISDCVPLQHGRIFVSGSTLVDNSFFAILVPNVRIEDTAQGEVAATSAWANSNTGHGNQFGLSRHQVDWIKTPANNPSVNKDVWSLVMRPSDFDPNANKTYPVAYLIHGGPQGAWMDSWSTRWNPAIFAQQGYIVVAPNPTGSTGYGQAFTDAIRFNHGGDPYEDIVNVFEWVGDNMPEADNSRAVALGASYGGYMVNWIQGKPLGRKFKCLVCHDGITSYKGGMLPTEELYFPFYDLGRPSWYRSAKESGERSEDDHDEDEDASWHRWDPSQNFDKWATPELIIHSARDFRLVIAEGLAAFNVLQARGVDSQFLTFPDENHWVLKPENSLVWHKVVLNWINKYSGLPLYSNEDIESPAFFGGLRESEEGLANMATQGDNST